MPCESCQAGGEPLKGGPSYISAQRIKGGRWGTTQELDGWEKMGPANDCAVGCTVSFGLNGREEPLEGPKTKRDNLEPRVRSFSRSECEEVRI